jgi:hypothetical protein
VHGATFEQFWRTEDAGEGRKRQEPTRDPSRDVDARCERFR